MNAEIFLSAKLFLEKISTSKNSIMILQLRLGWVKTLILYFMNSLCGEKAGMNRDAWKKGECEIYIFTAQVFGEEDK